jgi:hypothetical protein
MRFKQIFICALSIRCVTIAILQAKPALNRFDARQKSAGNSFVNFTFNLQQQFGAVGPDNLALPANRGGG